MKIYNLCIVLNLCDILRVITCYIINRFFIPKKARWSFWGPTVTVVRYIKNITTTFIGTNSHSIVVSDHRIWAQIRAGPNVGICAMAQPPRTDSSKENFQDSVKFFFCIDQNKRLANFFISCYTCENNKYVHHDIFSFITDFLVPLKRHSLAHELFKKHLEMSFIVSAGNLEMVTSGHVRIKNNYLYLLSGFNQV